MMIKCLGSSSAGNCYVIEFEGKLYILEAGIRVKEVFKAIDFRLEDIVGVFITHEHQDHSKYINEWLNKGIPVYATAGTLEATKIINHHNVVVLEQKGAKIISDSLVQTLPTYHDVKEPCAFIFHFAKGNNKKSVAFVTDTYKFPYKLSGIDCFMIEANYSKDILLEKEAVYRDRVITSHLPIDETIRFLVRSADNRTKNIMLLHLSDGNSNEKQFIEMSETATGIKTVAADKGMRLEIND